MGQGSPPSRSDTGVETMPEVASLPLKCFALTVQGAFIRAKEGVPATPLAFPLLRS